MEGAFPNRAEAGRVLGLKLSQYAGRDDVIVLGLPRGGVPVAYEVARALRVPLDVFIVRKLGVPGFEELAIGAIASGGVRVLNEDVARALPNANEIVDDGLATGATMRAAVKALRERDVARIVVAAPVGAPETCRELENEVDEIVCAMAPEYFQAVGQYYEDFSQTSDEEVHELLARAAENRSAESGQDRQPEDQQ